MASPKLRFKEFDEDWSDSKLGQLIGISSASRVFKEQWQTSGVPFFRTSDVVSISKNKENEKAYISLELFEELSKKSGKIQKGDLLVTGGGTIGIPYLVKNDEPLYFKDADLLWMKSSGIIDGSFLYNFFISPKFREYLKSISHTGTISHFTIEQAKVTPFQYPSKEEQTKIATFLSTVDEKISQLSQKLHLLSQYKQGMMQKLFSQQIRFKADDGSEFGEWEKTTLGLTGKFIGGGTPSKEVTEFWQGSIPWISSSDLVDESIFNINITRYISTEALNQSATKLIPANSILIVSRVGVGKVAVTNRDICTSQDFTSLVLNNGNPVFFGYLIKSLTGRLLEMNQGTSIKGFVKDDLSNLKVEIPNLAEQTKIANFLSAIDQKIDVVSKQLDQAKLWKKGLLQQMFV